MHTEYKDNHLTDDEELNLHHQKQTQQYSEDHASVYLNHYLIPILNRIFKTYHGGGKNAYELRGRAFAKRINNVTKNFGQLPTTFFHKYPELFKRYKETQKSVQHDPVVNYTFLWREIDRLFGDEMLKQRRKVKQ